MANRGAKDAYIQTLQEQMAKKGRAANRRTKIVILTEPDQFFMLLEPKKGCWKFRVACYAN